MCPKHGAVHVKSRQLQEPLEPCYRVCRCQMEMQRTQFSRSKQNAHQNVSRVRSADVKGLILILRPRHPLIWWTKCFKKRLPQGVASPTLDGQNWNVWYKMLTCGELTSTCSFGGMNTSINTHSFGRKSAAKYVSASRWSVETLHFLTKSPSVRFVFFLLEGGLQSEPTEPDIILSIFRLHTSSFFALMCLFFKWRRSEKKIIVAHAVLHNNLANTVLIPAKHVRPVDPEAQRWPRSCGSCSSASWYDVCSFFSPHGWLISALLTKELSWVRPRFEWTCNQFWS